MTTLSTVAPVLYIVVPCYNESEALPKTLPVFFSELQELQRRGLASAESRILLVDDGSRDDTWQIIMAAHEEPAYGGAFTGISFSHNRGHQNALFAGLMEARDRGCDCTISLDCDLQDDPAAMVPMLEGYRAGCEVVYGVRDNRDTDTAFKRTTAEAFYGLMRWLGVEMVSDSADYRLLGSRALDALSGYGEANLFLRGIVPSLGFKTDRVYYRRAERVAGESKYPLGKMVSFALEGITSFSVRPIRFVFVLGLLSLVIAVCAMIYAIAGAVLGRTVAGWTSLMVSIWFVGGLIMLSLGVVGEYVGRIYLESKHRPRYIVAERLD